jgi:hypothetical protein
MAGNKDGTIPPYTGGLTKPPANFVSGSGIRPDPFAAEKPLFSINAQNMAQYADKLTEGTKALMKRFSTFRIDVYKTHRTVAFPEFILKGTAKNAVTASTYNGGLSFKNAHNGIPFPIPKNGYEAMWNHLVRFMGRALELRQRCYIVDANGKLLLTADLEQYMEFPYYDEDLTRDDATYYFKLRNVFHAPARHAGEAFLVLDPIAMYEKGRIAYQYLPGQRRVKLAPEVAFDTPNTATSGVSVYDEAYGFNGSMERYEWTLIGKKEIYIPYNAYKAMYMSGEELFGPKHLNPDLVRWELHRVWVVEAKLRPGKRHCYYKRHFYLDEDSWASMTSEAYDAHGNLFKANFNFEVPSYDMPAPYSDTQLSHNMVSSAYCVENIPLKYGFQRLGKVARSSSWSPSAIAGMGVR